ncbi:MAG: hypothetical protein AAFY76_02095 [Cyanobacteria bacterium J06649_11]
MISELLINASPYLFKVTLGIVTISLGVYYYFKNIKRLVYEMRSTEVVSPTLKSIEKLAITYFGQDVHNLLLTNFIIYNNGRKTINSEDVSKLIIHSEEGRVFDFLILKAHSQSEIYLANNQIFIHLDEFDANDHLVLRIFHDQPISVSGRVKESGEVTRTEDTLWMKINLIAIIMLFVFTFFSLSRIEDDNPESWNWMLLTLLYSVFYLVISKFFHSKFYIPVSLSKEYLDG